MKRRDLIRTIASAASLNLLAPLARGAAAGWVKPSPGGMRIQRLAWAGIKIECDTTTLFIDATSSDEYKDMKLEVSTENRHALITHHHSDHYDPAALKTVFDKKSRLYCSVDTIPWIDTRDIRVQPVPLYHPIDVSRWTGDLVAIPVPAVDGFGHPQVSWVVQAGGKKIIHCGDTLWHGYWRDIGIAYGPFDIAFMPINGARLNQGQVNDTGIPAVLGPEQAVVASKLLRARMVCPIHYGRPESDYFETPDPEGNFLRFARERGAVPLLLKQGEWTNV
ncbi:L-ascorbate metabolism protein UlaG, beta-lactamase superfamily [Chitinophaga sp. YR573]|uniref:MBL fold metallo-hydrolase n=1 Tax=Chitinophaga sp. YR573 TaxID=1881040 RepID=UPI0008CA9231|nr:MBL fold metallo-hydrolase [Chitinophaga sp. YR573]SEW38869.1 L-ascorbate metabolism protein UlaG, beta-lactamase superfamily [Chitinophaga sp. YR573]